MRIIAKSALVRFWESRKADSQIAQRDLSTWYKIATHAEWANCGDLTQTFGSADQVGNCVVFDVGNNRFRLIGRVNYARGVLYVLEVMDHAEYDKNRWPDDCGCYKPPPVPTRRAVAKKATPKGRPARRGRTGGT